MADGGSASTTNTFDSAVEHLRTTSKWIVTVFAALGAVLATGTQFSSIGKLTVGHGAEDHRLWIAVIAGVVALIAIAVIISQVVGVLVVGQVNLLKLTPQEKAFLEQGYFLDGRSVEGLFQEAQQISRERDSLSPANKEQLERINQLDANQIYLTTLVANAKSALRYKKSQDRFDSAWTWMIILGFVTAVAFITFVWATNAPEDKPGEPPAFRVPVYGMVYLDADGQERLKKVVGETCVTQPVAVIVLGSGDGKADVVSREDGGCKVARFTIDIAELQPVQVESPTGTT